MFLTMAAHVAAMSPGTTIGAAHPVLGTGQDPDEAGEELAREVVSDVAALARAIASERGRNAEWAELAVRESRSATAAEALELRVVDRTAASERELLAALDGTRVETSARTVVLRTRRAELVSFEMSPRQRVLSVLGNPNLAYLLLMIGLVGLLLELSSPGIGVPGVVGVSALLLAAIGLDVLPVSMGALALLVLGAGLLVAEVYVTSYGALLAAGIAAIVAGSVLLVDPHDATFFADASVRVSWGAVLPMAIAMAAIAVALALYVRRAGRRRSVTGAEGLVGAHGETLSRIDASGGRVRVGGESWAARSRATIEAGHDVRVRSVRGLELEVEARNEGEA
jgi:membrane-bound serine protease (ClpP class)